MSKLLTAALVVAVLGLGAYIAAPTLSEMKKDSDAAKLVKTCYLTADQQLYFGLTKYNKETNMFDMEGALGGMIPIAGQVKRDGFLEALEKGEVVKEACPPGAMQEEE
jgi:hypothetical protein